MPCLIPFGSFWLCDFCTIACQVADSQINVVPLMIWSDGKLPTAGFLTEGVPAGTRKMRFLWNKVVSLESMSINQSDHETKQTLCLFMAGMDNYMGQRAQQVGR